MLWLKVCFVASFVFTTHAFAKQSVNWFFIELPPCHYNVNKQQGYCDQVEALFFSHITDFQFAKKPTSLSKLSALMLQAKPFCTIDLLKTSEREKHLVFSEPIFPLLPPVLVIRKNDKDIVQRLKTFQPKDTLKALNGSGIRLGVRLGRYYSSAINQFINTYAKNNDVYQSSSDTVLVDMIKGSRLDAMFLHAAELKTLDPKGELTEVEVGQVSLTPVYFACTKTELGYSVIDALNSARLRIPFINRYKPYMQFLPNPTQQRYKELIKASQRQVY